MIRWRRVETPVGHVILTRAPQGRIETKFERTPNDQLPGIHDVHLLPDVAEWLSKCTTPNAGAIPTEVPEGPPFHRACWHACRTIPFGQTRTYAELAAMAGSPRAVRAAGAAMRHNPQSLLTPCHRVVSSAGLGGFAGSTDRHSDWLQLKSQLLKLEQASAT